MGCIGFTIICISVRSLTKIVAFWFKRIQFVPRGRIKFTKNLQFLKLSVKNLKKYVIFMLHQFFTKSRKYHVAIQKVLILKTGNCHHLLIFSFSRYRTIYKVSSYLISNYLMAFVEVL